MGFPRRSDAEILKKPQGPGSPLPNADLLRDAIEAHTGHRVRFTIGDLDVAPPTATSTATETASVPVVDPEPAEEKAAEDPTEEAVTATESDGSDDAAASDEAGSDDPADTPPTPRPGSGILGLCR